MEICREGVITNGYRESNKSNKRYKTILLQESRG